jgi:hypothetical protein
MRQRRRESPWLLGLISVPKPIRTATGQDFGGFVTIKRRLFDHKHAAAPITADAGEKPRLLLTPVRNDIARGQYRDEQGGTLEATSYLFIERMMAAQTMRIEPYRYRISPADLLRKFIFQMTNKGRDPATRPLLASRRVDERLIIYVRIGYEDVVLVFRDKGPARRIRLDPSTVVDGAGCAMVPARSISICRPTPPRIPTRHQMLLRGS